MGFYSFWSVTGSIVTKAVGVTGKIIKPILNGITNINNVIRDTAQVLSVVPIIGAVSSQIGAAANIVSSVSAAGAEIIGVAERYVGKHAQENVVSMPPSIEETEVQMSPIESPVPPAVFDVTPQYFQPMQPLPAPIMPKSNVLSHPERHILRVKRPSHRQKSATYEKDEVDELPERMGYLNIGSNVPKTITPHGVCTAAGAIPGGSEAYLWESVDIR